jgi:hypothetical protein
MTMTTSFDFRIARSLESIGYQLYSDTINAKDAAWRAAAKGCDAIVVHSIENIPQRIAECIARAGHAGERYLTTAYGACRSGRIRRVFVITGYETLPERPLYSDEYAG